MNHKKVIIMRALPGAGKTTLAEFLSPYNVAADEWFDLHNGGEFDGSKLKLAHEWCRDVFEQMLNEGVSPVIVHNTNTQISEFKPYMKLANEYGYECHTVIVENRHESESIHNVPLETMEKMRKRFDICLGGEY